MNTDEMTDEEILEIHNILPFSVFQSMRERGSMKGRGIAVFTSGGDSQGMNAAVRAVVRFGIYLGCDVYFIKEGYQGMVDGGEHIVRAEWSSVSSIIHKGGTIIGSARCMDFKERWGRLQAANNLINRGITNLVVIGGDGSLTGANEFREQWPGLTQELVETGKISAEARSAHTHLNIVGMVGSIDNDFCGTDMTIGTDSALHRIIEAVDAIVTTAQSHQRTFVMEVMGRHCGYLALIAGIVSEADFVFIPEWPPEKNWRDVMCSKLEQERASGQRLNIIIVAEGAIDRDGDPITPAEVKSVIDERLKMDTRVTILGHIQRGGAPSAFDRILGSRMGAEAVLALMDATQDVEEGKETLSEACVVSLHGTNAVRLPLMSCVKKTQAVTKAMADKNWDLAVKLRGKIFEGHLQTYRMLTRLQPPKKAESGGWKLAVMHVGAPACGMNAAVRSFTRNCIAAGHNPIAIHNGISGLIKGEFETLEWGDVSGWIGQGGATLGTNRTLPGKHIELCAQQLTKNGIQGLLIIGGFEAYLVALEFAERRNDLRAFRIPTVVLPCTISNNVPGSVLSVGADTALNEITEICDRIRQSAQGTKRRVFIIETMGGYCGYLASMASMAAGADAAYIYEEHFGVKELAHDLEAMVSKMDKGLVLRGLILLNENANENYTSDFLNRMYTEEGKNHFTVRNNILGHMQQGGYPSPFDRSFATKLAARSVNWLVEQLTHVASADGAVYAEDEDTSVVLGLSSKGVIFQSTQHLKKETDFEKRMQIGETPWWMKVRPTMRILAQHQHSELQEPQTIFKDSGVTV